MHVKLGLTEPLHEDASPGRVTRGDEEERIIVNGEPARMWASGDDIGYYDENNDFVIIDVSYSSNPHFNNNDYFLVEIDGEAYPIDWRIAKIVEHFYEQGIKCLGSDQGEPDEEGFISIELESFEKCENLFR